MHDGVWVPAEDRAFTTRLARHCARAPVALERLAYEAATGTVRDQSDKATGPTAATETLDLLEWLARVVSHIPNKGPVLQRYYGWDANRTRGRRRRAGMPEPRPLLEPTPVEAAAPTLQKARRRWAELRRRIFGVDRLRCPRCGAPMRIVGFVTQPGVVARILDHLRRLAFPSALHAEHRRRAAVRRDGAVPEPAAVEPAVRPLAPDQRRESRPLGLAAGRRRTSRRSAGRGSALTLSPTRRDGRLTEHGPLAQMVRAADS